MMKNTFQILILSMLLGSLLSCNSGSGKGDAVEISMNWEKGKSYSYYNSADVQTEMKVMGTSNNFSMNTSVYTTLELLEKNKDVSSIRFTYDSMSTSYDSPAMNELSQNGMEILNGISVDLKMEDGKIVSIDNVDTLFTSVTDSMQLKVLREMFSTENLNSSYSMFFNYYPKKAVKVGESWKNKVEMKISALKLSMQFTYTLTSIENGLATISFNAVADDKGTFDMSGMSVPVTFKGSQKGKYIVLLKDGVLQGGESDGDFDITISMGGMEMPMNMKAKNTIKKL